MVWMLIWILLTPPPLERLKLLGLITLWVLIELKPWLDRIYTNGSIEMFYLSTLQRGWLYLIQLMECWFFKGLLFFILVGLMSGWREAVSIWTQSWVITCLIFSVYRLTFRKLEISLLFLLLFPLLLSLCLISDLKKDLSIFILSFLLLFITGRQSDRANHV